MFGLNARNTVLPVASFDHFDLRVAIEHEQVSLSVNATAATLPNFYNNGAGRAPAERQHQHTSHGSGVRPGIMAGSGPVAQCGTWILPADNRHDAAQGKRTASLFMVREGYHHRPLVSNHPFTLE